MGDKHIPSIPLQIYSKKVEIGIKQFNQTLIKKLSVQDIYFNKNIIIISP